MAEDGKIRIQCMICMKNSFNNILKHVFAIIKRLFEYKWSYSFDLTISLPGVSLQSLLGLCCGGGQVVAILPPGTPYFFDISWEPQSPVINSQCHASWPISCYQGLYSRCVLGDVH